MLRYYLIPLVLFLSHLPSLTFGGYALSLIGQMIANFVIFIVFFGLPFEAPDGSVGRVMW
jgi:hypothetical protein